MAASKRTGREARALLLAAAAAPAAATESGTGHYLLGSRDLLAGIVPPPGFYVSQDTVFVDLSVDQADHRRRHPGRGPT
ncbi:MAG: hypothetical protein SNJ79_07485 [Sphingomonadaceae bacterium]